MAKPNYSFEKRQRELAKKKKKEEKLKEKADRKANPDAWLGEPQNLAESQEASSEASPPGEA